VKHIWVLVFSCLALFSCEPKAPQGIADIGLKAPDFQLKDLEGKTVSLASLQNKVVLLEFWATWCPPCKTSVPELNELHKRYRDKDFVLLAISVDEGRNVKRKLTEFVEKYGVTYKIVISDDLTSNLYGVTSIPVMFLLDKQHVITKKFTGYSIGMIEELSKQIDKLL
jgi:peroxiredoxin